MNVLVTYFSQTGNTEKVAQALCNSIQFKKVCKPINEVKDVKEYDIIFCGFPVHAHSVPGTVQTFLKTLPQDQLLALFSTHGSLRNNQMAKAGIEHALSLASHAKILGSFGCRGKVDPDVLENLMKKPENIAWCDEAQSAANHPDKADIADAEEFAQQIISKVRALKS